MWQVDPGAHLRGRLNERGTGPVSYIAVTLAVDSIEASLRFYTEVLGFAEWFRWGQAGGLDAAGLRYGDGRVIMSQAKLTPGQTAHRGAGMSMYIDVGSADIDAIYARVKDRAQVTVPLADRPWGDRTFAVTDPDGYEVEFARTVAQG